ncbi:MAG: hypothetical protein SH850_18810 [Planctomycetaceae bacterium]|nr:hypothetical protein [Planctomycetaceae bacterium]
MNLSTRVGWAGLGMNLVLLSGCYMHRPYGPGYYNAGPMYGPTYSAPPGQYMAPGQQIYSPQNSGPMLSPGVGSPTPITPTNPSGTPAWRPDPNSGLQDAPTFRPNNGMVPDPLDPDFSAPPAAAMVPKARAIETVGGTGGAPMFPGDDPFEAPTQVSLVAPGSEPALRPAGLATAATTPQAPYGYDGQNYSFVKGIVDYDQQSKTWSIIYELKPEIGDKFGGSFLFASHPQLQTLKPGDLVLAKGRVDPGRTDTRGKPLYEIGTLVVLPALPGAR